MFSQSLVETSLIISIFPKGNQLAFLWYFQEIPASFPCPGLFTVTPQSVLGQSVAIRLVLVSSPQMNEQELQKGLTLEKSFPLCTTFFF